MPYKGHVENGTIVLDDAVELPEGTVVRVEPVVSPRTHHPDIARFSGILAADVDAERGYYQHLWEKHQ